MDILHLTDSVYSSDSFSEKFFEKSQTVNQSIKTEFNRLDEIFGKKSANTSLRLIVILN